MEIFISNTSDKPLYEQITAQIKNLILSGALAEGQALPSMRQLARDLRISVITTKRAYEDLEREGFLTNVPGKGCFVAAKDPALLREETLRLTKSRFILQIRVIWRFIRSTLEVLKRANFVWKKRLSF